MSEEFGAFYRDDYMCPFCVTPWKCNGPHVEPQDLPEFDRHVEWVRRRAVEDAALVVLKYAEETGQHRAGPTGLCNPFAGDRCDVVAALRVAADRIHSAEYPDDPGRQGSPDSGEILPPGIST